MLSNNNQLSLGGGGRQRARRTVRVDEPAYGFFVAGSSVDAMNGVYVRRNPPRTRLTPNALPIALYYEHEEGLWHMVLNELPQAAEQEEEYDEYDYYFRHRQKKPTHEWVFMDEFHKDRFTHEGDTIVPGAGVRWKHYHKPVVVAPPPVTKVVKKVKVKSHRHHHHHDSDSDSDSDSDNYDDSNSDSDSDNSEDDSESDVDSESHDVTEPPAYSTPETEPGTQALTEIKPDDENELPWQVIAILDVEMVQQLLYSSEHRKKKVRDAKMGKNAPAPTRASLEGTFAPGQWLFRVTAMEGVTLRAAADDYSEECGTRNKGEYVRVVKVSNGGDWICLDAIEDTAVNTGRNSYTTQYNNGRYYRADYARRELWVRRASESSTAVLMEEVTADDTAVLDITAVGELKKNPHTDANGAASAASHEVEEWNSAGNVGFTGDLMDKPFMPRVEDVDSPELQNEMDALVAAVADGTEDPALLIVKAATVKALVRDGISTGTSVKITGLRSRSGEQYNGVTGVVVTRVKAESGKQGVRLDAPFSGKMIACHPDTLVYCDAEDATEEETNSQLSVTVLRAVRLLGLHVSHIGLAPVAAAPVAPAAGESEGNHSNWGYIGSTSTARVATALRSCIRDAGNDISARDAARAAAEIVFEAVAAAEANSTAVPLPPAAVGARSPDLLLRGGALGSRTAAACVSALSALSITERDAGLLALRGLLKEETTRARLAASTVIMNAGEDSEGVDELLLRCVLSQALLETRREAEALEESRRAVSFCASMRYFKNGPLATAAGSNGTGSCGVAVAVCPAVTFLLSRCLLRQGHRADGLTELERAEMSKNIAWSSYAGWAEISAVVQPLTEWGCAEAARILVAHRAAERCRVAAVESYSRGNFPESSSLFARSIALLQTGFSDDKRGRATAFADKAGSLRRARQLDEAVIDLDAALRLFPRYARALFRKAACLLESGKAALAVDGFKELYRVDRDWPQLSEWLVRAFALQKRQARGYHAADEDDEDRQSPNPSESATPDSDNIAKEVDHYTVLGVTTDATEKQLKTAYRMRSLQFHPDRKQGTTAAFQRIAEAYQILSDADKRLAYDEGRDIKVKKGRRDEDDDSEEEDEEHKTTMREEVEREFYPERYHFWPFGDPFIYKRKREAQKRAEQGMNNKHDDYM